MAISKYIQQCDYRIGGLKPYIYLVHKNAMSINFKAKGVDVNFKKTKDSDVYKINASLCTYEQDETYANKYKFANTLEVSLNEQFREPFLYGLRTLRTNQYYIIIEDKKGVQYLINPELYTVLNYEYTFGDTNDSTNGVTITWTNINNHPLLIMEERIESNLVLLGEECPYNIGSVNSLMMTSFNDLKVNDDGVVADKLYVEDYTKIYSIDYLKKSFNLTETYDGNMFRTTMSFSIPLEENQFNWHYNLIEFKDNIYKAVVGTTNENYLILGVEKGLSAKYNITTSEDENNLNLINITFTQLSQYPIVYTNDITQYRWFEDGAMCFGFDKYQMLTQQYSEDWGETWITSDPIEKKKGDIIESDSEECKEYQWIDDGTYCYTTDVEYIDYRETTSYVCENGNKYKKLQKYSSTDDGKSYQAQEEYIKGDLVEEDSEDCNYIAIRWIDDNGYMCYPVNEDLTRWNVTGDTCIGYDLYASETEEVTNNGVTYYPTNNVQIGNIIKENCCKCGYRTYEYKFDADVCSSAITESNPTILDKDAYFEIIKDEGVVNGWTRSGNTFTSQSGLTSNVSVHRIHFKTNRDTIKFTIDQSSEKNYDYLIIGKLNSGVTNDTGSTNNYCNFKSLGIGTTTTSMTVPNDEDCFVELMYLKDGSSNKGRDNVIVTIGLEDNLTLQPYSMYERHYKWETCEDEYDSFNRNTGEVVYYIKELNSCDCEWTGTTWQWDGEETICGNVLCGELPTLTINRVQGKWTREGNTFTSNTISHSKITVERIYFSVSSPTAITFTIDQSSENANDYLVISNLDMSVVSAYPSTTGYAYNYYYHRSKTTGTTSMTISDTSEHFIELMYQKNQTFSYGRDNVIVTLSINNTCVYDIASEYEVWRETDCNDFTGNVDYRNPKKSCECEYRNYDWEWDETWEDAYICGSEIGLDSTSEYEVWKEYKYCPTSDGYKQYTGNVDYRNPKKSYKCDYVTYQWREEEITCGNALPENTTEVNKAPEINKDFE